MGPQGPTKENTQLKLLFFGITSNCAPAAIFIGVDISKVPGHHFLR